jgi:hypothetical protein
MIKTFSLILVLSSFMTVAHAQTTCPPLSNSRFVPGATVVLYNMSTAPPTIMAKFVLHADCSISGVGTSNVVGTYSFSGNANMTISLNSESVNATASLLSNITIGFYMISSTNVGNFLFPQIVQTTLNEGTGTVTKQSMSPYSPDGSSAGFQLAVFPDGFPKTASVATASLPKISAAIPVGKDLVEYQKAKKASGKK